MFSSLLPRQFFQMGRLNVFADGTGWRAVPRYDLSYAFHLVCLFLRNAMGRGEVLLWEAAAASRSMASLSLPHCSTAIVGQIVWCSFDTAAGTVYVLLLSLPLSSSLTLVSHLLVLLLR